MEGHEFTLRVGQDFFGGRFWYLCSCHASGGARATRVEAVADHQRHYAEVRAIARQDRLCDAAPRLLAAVVRGYNELACPCGPIEESGTCACAIAEFGSLISELGKE